MAPTGSSAQLRPDEIRVLRGMIDEYRYRQQRSRVYDGVMKRGHVLAATLLGATMFALQVISIYYAVRGHSTVIVRNP